MSDLIVDTGRRVLSHDGDEMRCLIGKSGAVAAEAKHEGDGASPRGRWPIRAVLLRPDRVPPFPGLRLPWRWLRPDDGWSDDPRDPAYNRPVRHPHPYSAERLWREDEAYDVILVLGHNDSPPVPDAGSAIFLHCTGAHDFTEGCVALAKGDLVGLLAKLASGDAVDIR